MVVNACTRKSDMTVGTSRKQSFWLKKIKCNPFFLSAMVVVEVEMVQTVEVKVFYLSMLGSASFPPQRAMVWWPLPPTGEKAKSLWTNPTTACFTWAGQIVALEERRMISLFFRTKWALASLELGGRVTACTLWNSSERRLGYLRRLLSDIVIIIVGRLWLF